MSNYQYPGGKAVGLPLFAGVETLKRTNPALTTYPLPQVAVPEASLPSLDPLSFVFSRGMDFSPAANPNTLPAGWLQLGSASNTEGVRVPNSAGILGDFNASAGGNMHSPLGVQLGRAFVSAVTTSVTSGTTDREWTVDSAFPLGVQNPDYAQVGTYSLGNVARLPVGSASGAYIANAPTIAVDVVEGVVFEENIQQVPVASLPSATSSLQWANAIVRVRTGAVLVGSLLPSEATDPTKVLPDEFKLVDPGQAAPQPVVGWILRSDGSTAAYNGTTRALSGGHPPLSSLSLGGGWYWLSWPMAYMPDGATATFSTRATYVYTPCLNESDVLCLWTFPGFSTAFPELRGTSVQPANLAQTWAYNGVAHHGRRATRLADGPMLWTVSFLPLSTSTPSLLFAFAGLQLRVARNGKGSSNPETWSISVRLVTGATHFTFDDPEVQGLRSLRRYSVYFDPVSKDLRIYRQGNLVFQATLSLSASTIEDLLWYQFPSTLFPSIPGTNSGVVLRQLLAIQGTGVTPEYAQACSTRDFSVPADRG